MKQFVITCIVAICAAIPANAQKYLDHLKQNTPGLGTVTISQSKEIDELVNGKPTAQQDAKPKASTNTKPTTPSTPASHNKATEGKKVADNKVAPQHKAEPQHKSEPQHKTEPQHKEEAQEWIDFIASTGSNLANMDYIWYASPNAEALAEYPAYYEETYGEPLDEELYHIMAIPDEERERCEIYVNLPQETLKFYDKLWTQLGV